MPSHAVGLSWKTRPSQFAAGRGASAVALLEGLEAPSRPISTRFQD
jgi:hypothetical protein